MIRRVALLLACLLASCVPACAGETPNLNDARVAINGASEALTVMRASIIATCELPATDPQTCSTLMDAYNKVQQPLALVDALVP